MGQHVLPGNPPVPLILRRSARARRISLRVSSLDGRVTLTLPSHLPDRAALDFAAEKEDWLRRHLSARSQDVVPLTGASLPVEGITRVITAGTGRSVRLLPDRIEVPGDPDRVPARLSGYLRALARDRLAAASDHYSAQLGLPYSRLTLRDTRSRWGSCTQDGALMYSWRLILAAPEILQYVAAHEVAHLAEMNHSQDFWNVVQRLYGDYRPPRIWLRRNGADLHRYRFDG
ncbi:M48 family peptidase [Pseudooceanicola sediminis]|uniref:M48 family peptidase n=1 Tax=Pseudooceanicola sediminis TaxID=2211117 RepID=A0A399IXA2_9RHOB|nr:SprT family zinc-dependent metalloprotease [Pseudooceanicola sediminis]KAA2313000.1 M48 family metallopeptidase [Puniceibacterium sp. HSS470]RII37600.1 M48 family peptidase [Pseudooceanicola sediminis]|tara:strand:+ start:42465 stop:43157 length:693 start_codon:yes stop_codon:yes gene_type:complete